MAIQIEFDGKLSERLGGAEGMEVAPNTAGTIHAALMQVGRAYPALHLFNCEGELRSILRLQKNGQPGTVRDALAEGDTLRLSLG